MIDINWNTYQLIALSWLGLGTGIFFLLQKIPAPYGRHSRPGWGPGVNTRWGFFIMEIVVFLVFSYWLWPVLDHLSFASWILVSFFGLHYFHRTFIFPFRLQVRGKKMPLSVVLMGMIFNVINGSLFGIYYKQFGQYSLDWLTDPRFLAGTLVFFIGMFINWRADYYLISLRKSAEADYKIPRGWLFELVSCPNLLGELIEWAGYALLTWSLPGLVFSIWTAANLIPRAQAHHRWYLKTFPDYPPQRRAIIPFLW